jgi:hypothetical protein
MIQVPEYWNGLRTENSVFSILHLTYHRRVPVPIPMQNPRQGPFTQSGYAHWAARLGRCPSGDGKAAALPRSRPCRLNFPGQGIVWPVPAGYVAAMQLKVKGVALSKNGRQWVEFVVEVENHRGWSVLRTFRDLEECRRFLAEQPEEAAIEFVGG